jgi:membrane-associated protease RseP (regulator of RpoE activity)
VSSPEYPPAPYPVYAHEDAGEAEGLTRSGVRLWLHVLLFLVTLFTTSVVGASMQYDFERNLPFDVEHSIAAVVRLWHDPWQLLYGLPFSLTLMTILLAHELGHYLACVYYRLDATLPAFLPAPPLPGPFGAFIRIRSAILYKRVLFDVGIAGPLAGFVFLLPALSVGLAFSKIIPGAAHHGDIRFGVPLLQWLLEKAIFPGVPGVDIYLHPVARAAWIGMLATALNLLPIGQLDGGHIIYAMLGNRHRLISKLCIFALVPLGIFYWRVWLVWAVVLYLLGRRHPAVYDETPLGSGRHRLGWLAMVVFILCFTVTPIASGGF